MAQKHIPKILVVDDEKVIRDITQAFLMLNGYDVDTAKNGKEALDKLLNETFDVVITDLKMPLMGGIDLLEKISKIKSNAVTIVLTGCSVNQTDFSKKPFAHLRKPFSHNQLIQVVQEGLKSQRAQQEN